VPEAQRQFVNSEYLPAGFDKDGKQIRPAGPLYAGQGGAWASTPGFATASSAPAPDPTKINTPADFSATYGKLSSGDTYTAPDGTVRKKK
jgi:hypothetical protein